MKKKLLFITFLIVIFAVSLLCLFFEFLQIHKSVELKLKRNTRYWKNQHSSNYINTDNDGLEPEEFQRMNIFDMQLKKVQIIGRIKVKDDFHFHEDGLDSQKGKGSSELILSNDIKTEIFGWPTSPDNNLADNTESLQEKPKNAGNKDKQMNTLPHSYSLESKFTDDLKQQMAKRQETNRKMVPGFVNLYFWDNVCEGSIESLKEFALFPSLPKFKRLLNQTAVSRLTSKNIGVRLFGILKPELSGLYRFGVVSSGNSELWLSTNTNDENKRKIAYLGEENKRITSKQGDFQKFSSQISEKLPLEKGKEYYFEFLYKHTLETAGWFEVAWTTPLSTTLQVIPGKFFSAFSSVTNGMTGSKSVTSTVTEQSEQYNDIRVQMSTEGYNSFQFMDFMDFDKAFAVCEYAPSYYVTKKLVRFQGARNKSNTHFAQVFPADSTNETLPMVKEKDIWWTENNYGNDVIDNLTAQHVWKMFTKAIETTYKNDFEVVKMLSLEQVVDKVEGTRYHIQMDIEDIFSGRHFEFSEFLYQPKGLDILCFPRDFRWNKNADVHIIVPVKNSGRWALYFIKNIAAIISKTLDPHIHVIIVDYDSTDVGIEAALKQSVIVRHTVVQIPGNKTFNRAEALQRGADVVKDPHSILFMCDLQLTMPVTLIGTIRKHCIEGKMAFAPVVKRLKCGYFPKKPFGYWETLGFGLLAIYKSDFDRVGAMNVDEFKNWGGEDWELLDRVLQSRMEVERLKIPDFYHFFHPPYGGEVSRFGV